MRANAKDLSVYRIFPMIFFITNQLN